MLNSIEETIFIESSISTSTSKPTTTRPGKLSSEIYFFCLNLSFKISNLL